MVGLILKVGSQVHQNERATKSINKECTNIYMTNFIKISHNIFYVKYYSKVNTNIGDGEYLLKSFYKIYYFSKG